MNSKWSEYYTSRIFSWAELHELYERGVENYAGCSLKGVKIQTLLGKGPNCKHCSAKIEVFASQRHLPSDKHNKHKGRLHFNGWHVNEIGIMVLMTCDHYFPKAHGGERTLENSQVLCQTCNLKKRDLIESKSKAQKLPP